MSQPADTVHQALLMCRKNSYPNTYRVLECLAVFPVTSTEGKRSFSELWRLNTFLRATMGAGRAPGRASFDAVPQAAGDPGQPGPAGPQGGKASAEVHDPGEHLSGIESLRLNQFCTKGQSVGVFIGQRCRFLGLYTAQILQRCN